MSSLYSKYKGKCGIYSIINTKTETSYIGSSVNIGRRLMNHLRLLRAGIHFNPHLQYSWNKYKESDFLFVLVEECEKEELAKREEYYINTTKSTYNVDRDIIRHAHPKSIVDLIASKNRGKKRSDKTKKILSDLAKNREKNPMEGVHRYGKEAPMYGKHHTEETKLKLSIIQINKNRGKRVIAYTEEFFKEFTSAIQASIYLNIPQQNIYECLKGKRKTARGFKFKYKDMEETKEKEVKKMTYSELENVAHQMSEQSRNLYMQNQQLIQKLQEANLSNFFKRLDWLWAIINSTTPYITEEFKQKCGEEFMNNMTLSPEEDNKEEAPSE